MHVPVALLTPEAQNIEPFRGYDTPNGFPDSTHDILEGEVFLAIEVPGHLFAVLARRNEHVAVEHRVFVQERDRAVVFVDDAMLEIRIACEELADEATAGELRADGVESTLRLSMQPAYSGAQGRRRSFPVRPAYD